MDTERKGKVFLRFTPLSPALVVASIVVDQVVALIGALMALVATLVALVLVALTVTLTLLTVLPHLVP